MCATAIAIALATAALAACAAQAQDAPQRVVFPSADGNTMLVGYVFRPAGAATMPRPAVVMMHGRAGPYSSGAKGVYGAATLSQRHLGWGELWAERGFIAIMVDGFGPRGYPKGFPQFSYDERPEELNEVTVRPLDAYGALTYLRTRADVASDRVFLMGWSNGGSATLAAMAAGSGFLPASTQGFRAALAFYPACGLKGRFDADGYLPYAPVLVLHGTADKEVSAKRCTALVERSRAQGGSITIRLYPGATHGFDDPGRKRQRVEANARATEDALPRAVSFFTRLLGDGGRR